jgi:hypothetical protein
MASDLIITRTILLQADSFRVWQILTGNHSSAHHGYEYDVQTDWQVGSLISWYDGMLEKQRKGYVLVFEPVRMLKFSKFDLHTGEVDNPENYVHVTYELIPRSGKTELQITLSNFGGNEVRAELAAQDMDLHVLPALHAISEGEVTANY